MPDPTKFHRAEGVAPGDLLHLAPELAIDPKEKKKR
jgi:hypothetical protein